MGNDRSVSYDLPLSGEVVSQNRNLSRKVKQQQDMLTWFRDLPVSQPSELKCFNVVKQDLRTGLSLRWKVSNILTYISSINTWAERDSPLAELKS